MISRNYFYACNSNYASGNILTYSRNGDYLIPNLTITEPTESIGKYGRMRKNYLKEHRPILYSSLLLSEKLYPHLLEMERTAMAQLMCLFAGETACSSASL